MIIRSAADLPDGWSLLRLPATKMPSTVLLAYPEFFDVREVKNAFMQGRIGTVSAREAVVQWNAMRRTFEESGVKTELLRLLPQCEDLVFTANPSFNGRRADGKAICVPSRMAFASRQPEVDVHLEWFRARNYAIVEMPANVKRFEGGGDAVWHPGRALIWAGAGPRTQAEAHEALADIFDVPVAALELADPRFYHLDTCFCALSETAALVFPGAFTAQGLALIHRVFRDVVEVDEEEAAQCFACNAAAFFGSTVVIQKGAERTVRRLAELGFDVREIETGEFMKSGGSVFCMKAEVR